jgi:organic radical activating enzyme
MQPIQQTSKPHDSSSLAFRRLKVSTRWTCNAACGHCSIGCGPQRREALEPAKILSCIEEAVKLGMVSIELTGGEPLLRPHELLGVMERARGYGIKIFLTTNGFWARTPDLARRRLSELRQHGLSSIVLSTDRFHQEFIPISRIVNALEACRELDIPASVIVCYLEHDSSLLETVATLHRHTSRIYLQAVAPSGRAIGLRREQMARLPFSRVAAPCHGATPTVAPDGRVALCCAPPTYMPIDVARVSPLILGWIDQEPLSRIVLRAQEDPFIQLLVREGVGAVLARIEELHPGLFQPRPEGYFGSCDLCMQVLGSEPLLSRIGPLLPFVATAV